MPLTVNSRHIMQALSVLDQAYVDYAWELFHMKYDPPEHVIEYRPTQGWFIDGEFWGRRVSRVLDEIDHLQRRFHQKVRDARLKQ